MTTAEDRAARVARNTVVRVGAEAFGKVASLVLLALLARAEGPAGMGTLVLALAWAELAVTAIDLGYDRCLMRRIAREPGTLDDLFANVLLLKARRTLPVFAVVAAAAVLLYDTTTRWTLLLLCAAFLLDSVGYTLSSVFTALERGGPIALALLGQRVVCAAMGAAALAAGLGVVAVAAAYAVAAGAAVVLGWWLLARTSGRPRLLFPSGPRAALRRESRALAAQEVLAVGLTRTDALLLSAVTTPVVVGYYGAAYRLFEATLLVSNALVAAFAAMFAYLPAREAAVAFNRGVKLSVLLLAPCGVALVVLADPLLRFAFGAGFGPASGALRVLAPTAVVLGVVLMAVSLIASRGRSGGLVGAFVAAVAANAVLNLALIGPLSAKGAAIAMLSAELLLAALLLRQVAARVGPVPLVRTLGGPVAGAAAMAAVAVALVAWPAVALVAGLATYGLVVTLVESRLWPDDLRVVGALARRRLRSAPGAL